MEHWLHWIARMSRILIAYTTSEGQTARVAEFLGEMMTRAGHEVDRIDLDIDVEREESMLESYALVVMAGSIHMGRVQSRLTRFAREHRDQLEGRCAFFLVCLTAMKQSDEAKAEIESYLTGFFRDTGLQPEPVAVFAGRLAYTQYGVLKRWMMKMIAGKTGGATDTSRDHEYTNWEAVTAFGERLAHSARASDAGPTVGRGVTASRISARGV